MSVSNIIRSFFRANQAICAYFDRALPESVNVDGNQYFINNTAPNALKRDILLMDIGGVVSPALAAPQKS